MMTKIRLLVVLVSERGCAECSLEWGYVWYDI